MEKKSADSSASGPKGEKEMKRATVASFIPLIGPLPDPKEEGEKKKRGRKRNEVLRQSVC